LTTSPIVHSAALGEEKPGDDIESPRDAVAITDTARVSRGGSFLSYRFNVRAAFRNWIKPSFASLVIGFRPARTMP
jgi:formylglycine-generating enzyme required for sulfatase activity